MPSEHTAGDAPHIAPVDAFRAGAYTGMTFPAYRALLAGRSPHRLALGLTAGNTPAGLGLGELLASGDVIVRSLYVAPALRSQGHATALLAALEGAAREAGSVKAIVVWMADQDFTPVVERVLAKRGWAPPARRSYVLNSNLASIDQAPWLTRARLEPDFETFLWTELTHSEREALERLQASRPLPPEVWPFAFSPAFEPHTSLGVRHEGAVVGWVVNHRYDENTIRFTCSYMREELQGRARLVAAYAESIERCRRAGYTQAVWSVPVPFARMVAFARRHLMPYATAVTETRGSYKRLLGS